MRKKTGVVIVFISLFITFQISAKNAVYHNKEGWRSLEKRDSVSALASFKAALAQNGNYREALSGLGYTYLLRKSYSDAYEIFNSLSAKYNDDPQVLLGKAHSLTGLSRYDEALQLYDRLASQKPDNVDAHYGKARVYYLLGKRKWALRSIDTVTRYNPYHYDTLLLAAKIQMDEGELDKSEAFIKKAINVRREYPGAYTEYGELLLRKYLKEKNEAILADINHECSRAILIDPSDSKPYKLLGTVAALTSDFELSADYFAEAEKLAPYDSSILYNSAFVNEKLGKLEKAEKILQKSLQEYSDEPFLNCKFETFLLDNNYAFGNPYRIERAQKHYDSYKSAQKKGLSDYSLYQLRLALLFNPLAYEYRTNLAKHYNALGYNRLYINELKHIERLHHSQQTQETLNVAVIKRRKRLYYKKGYSLEKPERSVASLFVAYIDDKKNPYNFIDAGNTFGARLTFALEQFGKVNVVKGVQRSRIMEQIQNDTSFDELIRILQNENINYICYGEYTSSQNTIDTQLNVLDISSGAIRNKIDLYDTGKERLDRVCYRAAHRIFELLPLNGEVLVVEGNLVLINLGLIDGVKPGKLLYTQTQAASRPNKKVLFEVVESDTYISQAKLINEPEKEYISKGNTVRLLDRKRSKLIK